MTTSASAQSDLKIELRLAVPITVLATLLALGIFRGVWNDRRDQANDPAVVSAKLQRTPLTFADWDGQDASATLPETPPGMIGPTAVRRYVNRKNGDVLVVFLTAGRPGPLLVNHLPTDCYPGIGYNLASGPTQFAVPLDAGSGGIQRRAVQQDGWAGTVLSASLLVLQRLRKLAGAQLCPPRVRSLSDALQDVCDPQPAKSKRAARR